MQARYLVVEGPIGAGKSSLARRLGERLGMDLLLEAPDANPFLPRFYQDAARYGLATQLAFLLQRVAQLERVHAPSAPALVADFMLEKDPLFAALNLSGEALRLYRAFYAELKVRAPAPDLVIYLQASAGTLRDRVRRRRIAYEGSITPAYLARLSDAYARFFASYSGAPLLVVNAERVNFVDRDRDFELLLQRVQALREPRAYFGFD